MVSSLLAGIPFSSCVTRQGAAVADPRGYRWLKLSGFISECRPTSNRNTVRLHLGMGVRLELESALPSTLIKTAVCIEPSTLQTFYACLLSDRDGTSATWRPVRVADAVWRVTPIKSEMTMSIIGLFRKLAVCQRDRDLIRVLASRTDRELEDIGMIRGGIRDAVRGKQSFAHVRGA